ncbi:bifunctional adenosylcobinamide kinase/adenosylcobinamide-phosphate guanylyltransferase [Granulosicoccus sp. 3-233]|uniref:bifunctional adenosylcobinamide kinase/adenosylcobinamide-phosphate guanylyltransferase n=1 Tax=Granulosicoccus sp. 3-233 TaxID=3417969 RepID=UPI003D3485C6
MKSLILGGVKSGKSRHAEQLATDSGLPVTVIATATADDTGMQARIARHQAERNPQWQLVEEPLLLGRAITGVNTQHCVLVDCLTLWLTNLLMLENEATLRQELQALQTAVDTCGSRLIMVSNETSMGIVPMGELSRRYCDEAGLLHQAMAQRCDEVVLMVAGLCHRLK